MHGNQLFFEGEFPMGLSDFLRNAYTRFDESYPAASGNYLGQEAIVNSVLRPGYEWRIKFQGCLWHARNLIEASFEGSPGDTVYVVARKGNTLLINHQLIALDRFAD